MHSRECLGLGIVPEEGCSRKAKLSLTQRGGCRHTAARTGTIRGPRVPERAWDLRTGVLEYIQLFNALLTSRVLGWIPTSSLL